MTINILFLETQIGSDFFFLLDRRISDSFIKNHKLYPVRILFLQDDPFVRANISYQDVLEEYILEMVKFFNITYGEVDIFLPLHARENFRKKTIVYNELKDSYIVFSIHRPIKKYAVLLRKYSDATANVFFSTEARFMKKELLTGLSQRIAHKNDAFNLSGKNTFSALLVKYLSN